MIGCTEFFFKITLIINTLKNLRFHILFQTKGRERNQEGVSLVVIIMVHQGRFYLCRSLHYIKEMFCMYFPYCIYVCIIRCRTTKTDLES